VDRGGRAICAADRDAIRQALDDLDAEVAELDLAAMPDRFWPVAGALLMNLRNILAALDPVAARGPLQVPPPKVFSG
jgi:hypothetical protein